MYSFLGLVFLEDAARQVKGLGAGYGCGPVGLVGGRPVLALEQRVAMMPA